MQFHISDILSVLTGVNISLPDCPPINPDGTKWPKREDGFEGIQQLIEYVTGQEIPSRINPANGKMQIDAEYALGLDNQALLLLNQLFPELAVLPEPKFTGQSQEEVMQQIIEWLGPLEKKYGAYLEVEAPAHKHVTVQNKRNEKRGRWGDPSLN